MGSDEGTLRVGLRVSGTALHTTHEVDADELEMGADGPVRRHQVDLLLTDATLRLDYGITQELDLAVVFPVRRVAIDAEFFGDTGQRLPGFASIHHRDETITGLGDVVVEGGLRLGDWRLRLGASLPTGDTVPDPYALGRAGERHQHVFFGGGTVQPRLGASAQWPAGPVQIRALAEATAAVVENAEGYRPGWRAAGEGAVAASLGLAPLVFAARLGLAHEAPSTWSGTPAENSGRTDLLPGVAVEVPVGDWTFALDAARPINLAAEGGQLEIPLVVGLTAAVRLPVKAAQ